VTLEICQNIILCSCQKSGALISKIFPIAKEFRLFIDKKEAFLYSKEVGLSNDEGH